MTATRGLDRARTAWMRIAIMTPTIVWVVVALQTMMIVCLAVWIAVDKVRESNGPVDVPFVPTRTANAFPHMAPMRHS